MFDVTIVGCGDIGLRVARRWQERGHRVTACSRSAERLAQLAAAGLSTCALDLDVPPAAAPTPPLADTLVYYFVPPPADGQSDPRMACFIDHLEGALIRGQRPWAVVLLGTTGIYGDQAGRLVNEDTPPNPQTDRGRRRLDAETRLRDFGHRHGITVVTLRVGGIYDRERLPLARIRRGTPLLHEHLAPQTNRIHADDLAAVCVAAGEKARADAVYNVSDGQDSNMTEYFFTIADCLGLPRPPTVDWDEAETLLSAGMLSYLRESRRLDTRRMREELGVELGYPDLRSALARMFGKHG
ncbi:MAG TPA: SDR family oxidoreductase [Gammaproteobacteria bacterium]|nr:SDR family oxidoreductase [Gammaproteobacteria bacterium]